MEFDKNQVKEGRMLDDTSVGERFKEGDVSRDKGLTSGWGDG